MPRSHTRKRNREKRRAAKKRAQSQPPPVVDTAEDPHPNEYLPAHLRDRPQLHVPKEGDTNDR
jgi:hypothetical protein